MDLLHIEGGTINQYARKVDQKLWPKPKTLSQFRICDDSPSDRSKQSERAPFTEEIDLEKINLLKGKFLFINFF